MATEANENLKIKNAHHDYGAVSTVEGDDGENSYEEDEASFLGLMKNYRCFRLYLLSYIITHCGEWFTYIASITLAEKLLGAAGTTSRTTISILVVVRLLPNVLLAPFGGILADGRDRRESMIFLDIIGAISPLLFFFAMYFESIGVIYLVTFIQQCISGLYEPCRSAIIPLLVPEEEYLKKATTLAGLCWSLFAAVGSSLGGLVLTLFGFKACFILDSLTYLTSAYLMWLVGGTWNTATDNESIASANIMDKIHSMAVDGGKYLRASWWGCLVFLKASGGIVYGAGDVLNVSFSEPNGINDKESPARLGMLFACMGLGYFSGPLIADRFTSMQHAASIQKACIIARACAATGCFGMGLFDPIWSICLWTWVRSAGAAINWIDSSLLLQKFSSDEMMGRVLSVDFSLALWGEASSAFIAGMLQDQVGMTASKVAFVMAAAGATLALVWSLYYICFGAAAFSSLEAKKSVPDKKSTARVIILRMGSNSFVVEKDVGKQEEEEGEEAMPK